MYNILVIEDDAHQLKNLINIISIQCSNIRIYNMSFNAEDCLNLIQKQIVDIIILDLKLENMSGIDLIAFIENNKLYKYKHSIIVFSGELELINTIIKTPYLFSYHLKSSGYNNLIKSLKLLINEKNNESKLINVRNKICKELEKLNYNFTYDGTKYLIESILEVYKIRYDFDGNFERNIYPIIARKYNKKVNTIYCNIKQSTKYMLLDCEEKTILDYFNYTFWEKPKIQEIIFTVLNKIS